MSSIIPIEMRLKAVVRSWQMPIAPGCQHNLLQLIDQASQRFKDAGFASNPNKLQEAETNFQKVLTEMTWEAGRLGFNELHEPALSNVLSRICPLFPFC